MNDRGHNQYRGLSMKITGLIAAARKLTYFNRGYRADGVTELPDVSEKAMDEEAASLRLRLYEAVDELDKAERAAEGK